MERVSREEIEKRIKRFQAHMKGFNISGAIILQNVDRFYFSGTIQISTLFIPCNGEPILIVHKGFERARNESPLNNIIKAKEADMKNILKEFSKKMDIIGMEFDVLPTNIYFKYQKIFNKSKIIDISQLIRKTRMIKSDYEIEQIKKAAEIVDENFQEIQGFIRPGITEVKVDAYLGYLARKKGHMGVMRMRKWNQEMIYAHVLSGRTGAMISFLDSPQGGDGTSPAMAQGAGFKKIRENEPIEIDHGACVNGYMSDESRTFVIGDLSDELKRAHECSWEIHHFFAENAKPGVYCNKLYDECLGIAKAWGLEEYFMGYGEGKVKFVGHGVGLEIDEYPIISPYFKEPLQENMVLALEPKFIFPNKGVVGLEDMYVIRRSGTERITQTEQKIIKIKNN